MYDIGEIALRFFRICLPAYFPTGDGIPSAVSSACLPEGEIDLWEYSFISYRCKGQCSLRLPIHVVIAQVIALYRNLVYYQID